MLKPSSLPPELDHIDQIIRLENALIVFPHQQSSFTIAVLRDPDGKTQQDLACEPTVVQALATGVRLRLAETVVLATVTTLLPSDAAVLTTLRHWHTAGRWLETTRDESQIAVTLHGYRYEQGDLFVREGSTNG